MTVSINVTFANLYPDIQRHLSLIGKRLHNKNGENMFSAVTLSSAEKDIMAQYMQQGAENVVAAIQQFVSNYIETTTGVTFHVTNTRWNDIQAPNFYPAFIKAFNSYLINYTLSEYLSMNFPELAKKYIQAALNFLTALIHLVFFKAPPAPSDGEQPSVDVSGLLIIKNTVNIGTESDPFYAFYVPLTDFTYYNITSVDFSDVESTQAFFDIKNPGLTTTIVADIEPPHDFTTAEITSIRGAGTEFVVFYPNTDISENDTLTLNYTL